MDHEADEKPSRTRRKREAENLQAVGERLLALTEARLAQLPLPEALRDAIETGRRLQQRGALRRQRQYIGRLMRELDTTELQDTLAAMDRQEASELETFHAAENWRERMLNEGTPALEAFFDTHPGADRQRVRQLLRACQGEMKAGLSARHQRELFRAIRQVLENGS